MFLRENFVASRFPSFIVQIPYMESLDRMLPEMTHAEALELSLVYLPARKPVSRKRMVEELAEFREFGQVTRRLETAILDDQGKTRAVPTLVNEFWTAKQRQAHSLHEISYRACFKPQLPRFFIERLTEPRPEPAAANLDPGEYELLSREPRGFMAFRLIPAS